MRFVKRLANTIMTYVPNMIHICPNTAILISIETKNIQINYLKAEIRKPKS